MRGLALGLLVLLLVGRPVGRLGALDLLVTGAMQWILSPRCVPCCVLKSTGSRTSTRCPCASLLTARRAAWSASRGTRRACGRPSGSCWTSPPAWYVRQPCWGGLRRGAGRRRAELSLGQTLESPPPEHRPQALRSTFQDAQDTPGWARASEGKSHCCELLRRRRGGVRRALLPRARRQHSRVTAASLHRCRLSAPCSA